MLLITKLSTQNEQEIKDVMFKEMCQAFRRMSLRAADCKVHGNEVVVDSNIRIKEWRKLLSVKQFTQSVVDFEITYKEWRKLFYEINPSHLSHTVQVVSGND